MSDARTAPSVEISPPPKGNFKVKQALAVAAEEETTNGGGGVGGDVTWMASTFTGGSSHLDEYGHDLTFAPPNSPMNYPIHPLNSATPLSAIKHHRPPPHPLNISVNGSNAAAVPLSVTPNGIVLEGFDKASPVVGGVLDDTWINYVPDKLNNSSSAAAPITIPPQPYRARKDSYYPYHPSHDHTFRNVLLASHGDSCHVAASGSVNTSNQFLNESNFELLQNSLLECSNATNGKKRRKSNNSLLGDDVFITEDEEKAPNDHNNNDSKNEESKASAKITDPIIQMFLNTNSGDTHHIFKCIEALLSSGVISPGELCTVQFLDKAVELMKTSTFYSSGNGNGGGSSIDTLFNLFMLFEKHLINGENVSEEQMKSIDVKCRKPFAKLALAGNEELSQRAEVCLTMLDKKK